MDLTDDMLFDEGEQHTGQVEGAVADTDGDLFDREAGEMVYDTAGDLWTSVIESTGQPVAFNM